MRMRAGWRSIHVDAALFLFIARRHKMHFWSTFAVAEQKDDSGDEQNTWSGPAKEEGLP